VVITGLGGVCSIGNSVPEIARELGAGRNGIVEIGDLDEGFSRCLAALVRNPPEVKTDIPSPLARSMGKTLSLLLASAGEALKSAGIGPGTFDPEEIGFFAAMGMVDYRVEDLAPAVLKSLDRDGGLDYDRFFEGAYQKIYPLWPLGMLNNIAFCQAAIHFGLRGENCVFSPHGDAGIQAVAEAVKVLEEGKAKAALAGGVSEELSPFSLARARLKGSISRCGGKPEAGIPPGECGAMLVLEPLSLALERGADILAGINGFDFTCRLEDKGRSGRQAASLAIRGALSNAGLDPDQIDLIMLAGSSRDELEAVWEIFHMSVKRPIMVLTGKSLGEMLAAGPILNAAIGLSLEDPASLPPDIQCLPPGPCQSLVRSNIRRILVNGISYEGRYASMIIEKANGETL
jgi:3-oxoacyl-[acyl-carrier-protein] synthase II